MKDTSWGGVADWYGEHLEGSDTYHAKVIAPNLIRVVAPKQGVKILDLACGEGYFARMFKNNGADVIGTDIAESLIQKAKAISSDVEYHVANAENLGFAKDASFDTIVCALAIQNMEHLDKVFAECARVLKHDGRLVFVLNHPTFRIPKRSSWGWDDANKIQYRRMDAYLSMSREKIDMSPSQKGNGEHTWSFHRSLQDYSKALNRAGFAITKMEEWISHKQSEKGPRQEAEDRARKEIPLFLTVECRLLKA